METANPSTHATTGPTISTIGTPEAPPEMYRTIGRSGTIASDPEYRGSRSQYVVQRAATAPRGVAGNRPNQPRPLAFEPRPPPTGGVTRDRARALSHTSHRSARLASATPSLPAKVTQSPSYRVAGSDQAAPKGVQATIPASCSAARSKPSLPPTVTLTDEPSTSFSATPSACITDEIAGPTSTTAASATIASTSR